MNSVMLYSGELELFGLGYFNSLNISPYDLFLVMLVDCCVNIFVLPYTHNLAVQ